MKSRYEMSAASLRGLWNASRNGEVISLLSNWLNGDGISWNETQKVQLYERFTHSDLYISGLSLCEKASGEMKTDGCMGLEWETWGQTYPPRDNLWCRIHLASWAWEKWCLENRGSWVGFGKYLKILAIQDRSVERRG